MFNSLTKRQRQIVALLMDGVPNQDIRAKLGIDNNCFKVHMCNIRKKFAVKTIGELIRKIRQEQAVA